MACSPGGNSGESPWAWAPLVGRASSMAKVERNLYFSLKQGVGVFYSTYPQSNNTGRTLNHKSLTEIKLLKVINVKLQRLFHSQRNSLLLILYFTQISLAHWLAKGSDVTDWQLWLANEGTHLMPRSIANFLNENICPKLNRTGKSQVLKIQLLKLLQLLKKYLWYNVRLVKPHLKNCIWESCYILIFMPCPITLGYILYRLQTESLTCGPS